MRWGSSADSCLLCSPMLCVLRDWKPLCSSAIYTCMSRPLAARHRPQICAELLHRLAEQVDLRKPYLRGRRDPTERARVLSAFNSRRVSSVFSPGAAADGNEAEPSRALPMSKVALHRNYKVPSPGIAAHLGQASPNSFKLAHHSSRCSWLCQQPFSSAPGADIG